ncbi:lysophospholipid acyltransferase LPCAT4 isoform X2 [Gouania willdenowi]|nr:lysophospholipid acyltransferase LPCAT4 isoform X2 [Gouania willdenowi]
MWPIASLRMVGLSEEQRSRPVTGWRRWLYHSVVRTLSRAVFFSLGFLWMKVKGRRADLKEAPMLVVAPHSGFLDMLVLCPTELATVVSRSENQSLPVIGALLEFNQSVIVSRKDPESRKNAVSQLVERLTSNGYWPQMLMFPEGTTTNGQALIKFKPGAFVAGMPVQPVLLRYPNKLDTVRWTYKGSTWLDAVWHTTSQLYTNMTVEFLPVYKPSEEEKENPELYADNVQKLMARALGVPATDYVMEGGIPVRKLGGLSLPLESPAKEMLTLLHSDGLTAAQVAQARHRMLERCRAASGSKVSVDELHSILSLSDRQTTTHVCGLFSKDDSVDLTQIYISLSALTDPENLEELLHFVFPLFDSSGEGSLSAEQLSELMGALLGVPQRHTAELYEAACTDGRLTEGNLLHVLTSHPTYGRALSGHLLGEEAGLRLSDTPLANGNNNNSSNNKKLD